MKLRCSGVLCLAAVFLTAWPSPSSAPPATPEPAPREHCSLTVPFEVTLQAQGSPTPGSPVTIVGEVLAKADFGAIQVAGESAGSARMMGLSEMTLMPAAKGDMRTFSFDVNPDNPERWSVDILVAAQSPDGSQTWERTEGFFGVVRNGRLLTGMGSHLQLLIKAIEDDYHAGILTEEAARAETKELLTLKTVERDPLPAAPLTLEQQRMVDALRPTDAGPVLAPAGGCYHISGNIQWQDENGNWHPAFGLNVQIWDEDLVIDEFVDVTSTDANGNYSIDVNNDDGFGAGDRDLYVRVVTANSLISIEPAGIFTSPYQAESGVYDEHSCAVDIVENFAFNNSDPNPAVSLTECASYVALHFGDRNNGGSYLPQIVAEWPGSTTSANYDGSDFNLRPGDRWDWDVFMHEYGHYIFDTFNLEDNPGGPHNIGDCISDVHASKEEGVDMAWGEGWPTYNGTVVQIRYNLASLNVPRVGDNIYADSGESNFSYSLDAQDNNGLGEDNEVAMQRVFFDFFDSGAEGRDNIAFSDLTLWNIINGGSNPETLSQAWNQIRSSGSVSDAQELAFGEVLTDHFIGPSLNTPAENAIVSPSNNNNFSWDRNVGCSTTYDGDGFTLRFFRADNSAPLLSLPVGNTLSRVLTLGELQSLVAATHNVLWAVEGSNSSSPATGPYLGESFAITINQPPVADAGTDVVAECTSATTTPVQLNGTGSSDPDGDNLTYTWSAPGVTFDDDNSATPTGQFPGGATNVTLEVSDGIETDTDQVLVTIVDTTPPEITCPVDVTIECNDHCEGGGVPKDDAQLTDFFSDASATDICDTTPAITNDAPDCFPVGETTVTFTACDDDDNCSECTAVVTVEDTTPPEITVELDRDALWPPNHKMSSIEATVTVTDICDPNPTFVLTSITSNEPDNGLGDGDTENDIQFVDYGTDDTAFSLRSERAGVGDGRKYTIIYTASDISGNTATDTVCVRVPHDQSGNAMAATGFNTLGTGFDPLVERYRMVVFATPTFRAGSIDAARAYIGNYIGVITPVEFDTRDLNGDNLLDLELVYDVRSTRDLRALSTKRDDLGLHYRTADGTDYLVRDIFKLGRPFAIPESDGNHESENGIVDGNLQDTGNQDTDTGLTSTGFEIATGGRVAIEVFTVTGRKVRTLADREFSAGRYDLSWDGRSDSGARMPSGIYFYRISAPGVNDVRKIHVAR